MRIPVYLAVAQWALLLALGALVVLMFRQLGRHLGGTRPAGDLGPQVGSLATGFDYARLDTGARDAFRPGDGRPSLIAFVDPTCPACEELVSVLTAADADGELAGVSALLLMQEPPSYLKISDPFQQTRLPLGRILADATLAAYRVSATPLLVAVDGAGAVRAAGPAARRSEVRSFVQACLLPAPAGAVLPVLPDGRERQERHLQHDDVITVATAEER